MSDIVEAVARAICVAEGLDPDQTGIGFGYRIPVGVEYTLWEAQRKNAEAAIAAVGVETERLRARVENLERVCKAAQLLIDIWSQSERSDWYCGIADLRAQKPHFRWDADQKQAAQRDYDRARAALEAKP